MTTQIKVKAEIENNPVEAEISIEITAKEYIQIARELPSIAKDMFKVLNKMNK